MEIKPRQCIAALNAHVRSGFPLVGDAETSVYAKDIIETIQRLVLKLNEANKAYEASEVDSGFEALTAYHHGYQEGLEAAQPEWISLKERLPEFERRVLVMNGHGDVFILAFWRKTENKWSWVDDAGHFKHYNNITHWMPLPSTEVIE